MAKEKHKYIKPKPETTTVSCLTCGKLLKDFELLLGCTHCKIKNARNGRDKTKAGSNRLDA